MKKFETKDYVFIAFFVFLLLSWLFSFPKTLYWLGALIIAIIYFWLAYFRQYFRKR